jgi:hypothetical protein
MLKRAEWPCLLELFGIFAGFFYTEHDANLLQKIRQLLHKLGVSLGPFSKVQQFLADQIIQRVGKAKACFDAPRGRALSISAQIEFVTFASTPLGQNDEDHG